MAIRATILDATRTAYTRDFATLDEAKKYLVDRLKIVCADYKSAPKKPSSTDDEWLMKLSGTYYYARGTTEWWYVSEDGKLDDYAVILEEV